MIKNIKKRIGQMLTLYSVRVFFVNLGGRELCRREPRWENVIVTEND